MELESLSLEDQFKLAYAAWQSANQVSAPFSVREALWCDYVKIRDALMIWRAGPKPMAHPRALA